MVFPICGGPVVTGPIVLLFPLTIKFPPTFKLLLKELSPTTNSLEFNEELPYYTTLANNAGVIRIITIFIK